MKEAVLRPQALRDQQGEVRYYRQEGGTRSAVKWVYATNAALDQIVIGMLRQLRIGNGLDRGIRRQEFDDLARVADVFFHPQR